MTGAIDPQDVVGPSGRSPDGPAGPGPAAEPVLPLSARGISKRFGPRLVLDHLDLDVRRGEVHALLGANGSGKSTFVKIVSGNQPPTSADRMTVGGQPVTFPSSVQDMQSLGLRVVHQDLGLVDELTITENIALSRHYLRSGDRRIDWRATRQAAQAAVDAVGLDRPVGATINQLAAWERVAVVFARVLYGGLDQVKLLILDEITAALPTEEVERVIEIVGRLKQAGAGVLYVTHRFEEVFQVADQLTILRDGKLIHRSTPTQTSPDELINLVAGHTLDRSRGERDLRRDSVAIALDHVSNEQLDDVSLSVRAGEIVGVVGRAGCGRSALGRVIFGLQREKSGRVLLEGTELPAGKPWRRLEAGIAYVGQDRGRAGSIHGASVEENFTIASLDKSTRFGWLSARRERSQARSLIEQCEVVPPDPGIEIQFLSGGNQQKIVVGRWIPRHPKVLVLDEPTEGVDVGARQGIYQLIRQQAEEGCAVLVLSSSIEELVQLSNRVLFMDAGRVASEVTGDDLSIDAIEKLLLYREIEPVRITEETV